MVELLIFLGYLAGFWKLLNVLTPDVDDHAEIFVRHNWPYLVQRLGISLAQAIGMLSSIGISSPNRWSDVLWLLLAGAWVSLLLFAVHPVVDRAVLRANRHRV